MITSLILFFCLHTAIWFSTNYQFTNKLTEKSSLLICLALAIPISVSAFYASKYAYEYFESAWSVKLVGFGIGYIVFPILTWFYLHESPFSIKTMTSILLAFIIIGVQLFFPNS